MKVRIKRGRAACLDEPLQYLSSASVLLFPNHSPVPIKRKEFLQVALREKVLICEKVLVLEHLDPNADVASSKE